MKIQNNVGEAFLYNAHDYKTISKNLVVAAFGDMQSSDLQATVYADYRDNYSSLYKAAWEKEMFTKQGLIDMFYEKFEDRWYSNIWYVSVHDKVDSVIKNATKIHNEFNDDPTLNDMQLFKEDLIEFFEDVVTIDYSNITNRIIEDAAIWLPRPLNKVWKEENNSSIINSIAHKLNIEDARLNFMTLVPVNELSDTILNVADKEYISETLLRDMQNDDKYDQSIAKSIAKYASTRGANNWTVLNGLYGWLNTKSMELRSEYLYQILGGQTTEPFTAGQYVVII